MTTILSIPNGKAKAILRSPKGRYLRSRTCTRKTDARTWVRRMEAGQEAMEALGETGTRLPFSSLTGRFLDALSFVASEMSARVTGSGSAMALT